MGIFSGKKKSTVFKSNAGDEILVAPENFNVIFSSGLFSIDIGCYSGLGFTQGYYASVCRALSVNFGTK